MLAYKVEKSKEAVKLLFTRLRKVKYKVDGQNTFSSTIVCWTIKQCWYLLFGEEQRAAHVPTIIWICAMMTMDAEKNDWDAVSQEQM